MWKKESTELAAATRKRVRCPQSRTRRAPRNESVNTRKTYCSPVVSQARTRAFPSSASPAQPRRIATCRNSLFHFIFQPRSKTPTCVCQPVAKACLRRSPSVYTSIRSHQRCHVRAGESAAQCQEVQIVCEVMRSRRKGVLLDLCARRCECFAKVGDGRRWDIRRGCRGKDFWSSSLCKQETGPQLAGVCRLTPPLQPQPCASHHSPRFAAGLFFVLSQPTHQSCLPCNDTQSHSWAAVSSPTAKLFWYVSGPAALHLSLIHQIRRLVIAAAEQHRARRPPPALLNTSSSSPHTAHRVTIHYLLRVAWIALPNSTILAYFPLYSPDCLARHPTNTLKPHCKTRAPAHRIPLRGWSCSARNKSFQLKLTGLAATPCVTLLGRDRGK